MTQHIRSITKPKFIIWVDPGLTNGFAEYDVYCDRMILGEYDGPECMRVLETAKASDVVIGAERFIITSETAKKSQDAQTHIEMVGMMRYVCSEEYSGFRVLEFNTSQTSSVVKEFCTNRILRELGWWRPGYDHCHDAARHIFYYLAQNNWLNEKQKEALVPK